MRAFIAAKIGLLPFVLFWALSPSAPRAAIGVALALSIAAGLWRWRRGEKRPMESAGLLLFAALALGLLVAPATVLARANALSFLTLGLAAFLSLKRKAPWTAAYAAAQFPQARESPIFLGVNMALSSLWAAIFFVMGLLAWFGAGAVALIVLPLIGAVLSIFGPNWIVRAALRKRLATQTDFDWPAPALGARDGLRDVVVIGAGMGGLAAAALLAARGLRVTVYEQHVLPGGFCHSWLRKAHHDGKPLVFRFDAGPHDFSGAHPGGSLDLLLRRLGCASEVEWLRHDYRFIDGRGEGFDPPRDWRAHADMLAQRFPDDAEGVRSVFATMKALFDAMTPEKGFPGPPESVEQMLQFAEKHPLFLRWGDKRFVDLLAHFVSGSAARDALAIMAGYISDDPGAPSCAEMAPIFGYHFVGGYFPRGGTGRFAEVLADAVRRHGGDIVFKTGVREILVEHGRAAGVRLDSGEIVRARAVVANSDPRKTFLEMLDPANLPEDFMQKLRAAAPAASGFGVHLGVLGVPEGRSLTFVRDDDVDILIARPGLLESDDAPEGFSAIDLFTLLPHEKARLWFPSADGAGDGWKELRRSEDYERRKREFGDALIARAEKALPGLREKIVYRSEASPLTYARYDRSSAGAVYGVAPAGRMKGAKSPIPGLAIAGAMILGPGVEAVVLAGVWAAEALCPGASQGNAN